MYLVKLYSLLGTERQRPPDVQQYDNYNARFA